MTEPNRQALARQVIPVPAGQPAWRTALDVVAVISMTIAAAVVIWFVVRNTVFAPRPAVRAELALPLEPVAPFGGHVLGSPNASVVLMVFSDFQCPYCQRFAAQSMPTIWKEYVESGRIQLAFWNFPLDIHPLAPRAAEFADCAAAQGHMREMHDGLFAIPRADFAERGFQQVADSLPLDHAAFASCAKSEARARVSEDVRFGKTLKISVTPSFFIASRLADGRLILKKGITGAKPTSEFTSALDQEVNARPK